MNSFFLFLNKISGKTSHDILIPYKKQLGKIGHCGTLDPLAEGLMIAGVNKALKVIKYLNGLDKRYRVKMLMGIKTDTQDITGKILDKKESEFKPGMLDEFSKLKGEFTQVIPAYSAKKYKGKRLYKYARQGEEVPVLTKKINIKEISNTDYKDGVLSFDILCSAGTYIRALSSEIENIFSSFCTMKELKRTAIGPFSYAETEVKISIKDVLEKLMPSFNLNEEDKIKLKNGMRLKKEELKKDEAAALAVINGEAAACGPIKDGVFHPKEVLL